MWGETRSGISTSLLKDRLLVTLQGDLTGDIMERLQTEVLGLLQAHGLKMVVFDVSAVDVIDLEEFAAMQGVASMARFLGAVPVLIGLQPGVVAFLAGAGVDTSDLITARGLQDVDRVVTLRMST
jgi:rsbT antagonist protein RsbS